MLYAALMELQMDEIHRMETQLRLGNLEVRLHITLQHTRSNELPSSG
jgi:hypothetical protein